MFYILIAPEAEPVYPYSLTDLRRANPQTSFPKDMANFDATAWHCHPVRETTPPEAIGKVAQPTMPELVDGVWTQTWVLVEHTVEDIERQWANIRSERNQRLAESDWTQLADAPLTNTETADWGSYRQALRDITTQSDPFNIQWPTPPGA